MCFYPHWGGLRLRFYRGGSFTLSLRMEPITHSLKFTRVLRPVGQEIHFQTQKNFLANKFFDFFAGSLAYFFDLLAALADHDSFLRVAFDMDGGFDAKRFYFFVE